MTIHTVENPPAIMAGGDLRTRRGRWRHRLRDRAIVVSLPLLAVYGSTRGVVAWLFRADLGIPTSSKMHGVEKFAAFMASLSTPLLVSLAAVAPIALIFGAGALMLGNRRAVMIIAGTVGALALAASASGLVQ